MADYRIVVTPQPQRVVVREPVHTRVVVRPSQRVLVLPSGNKERIVINRSN